MIKWIRKISMKKYAVIFITACCLYNIISYNSEKSDGSVAKVDIKYVAVHFDLKGSPPLMSYMINLLTTLKKYGVNSILMEYEDMFPYDQKLANLSSEIAYTKKELIEFLLEARRLDIEIIPLIQTFGHMEFVLKLNEFRHTREQPFNPGEICPSQRASTNLIRNMLQQVISFHNDVQPLKYIHVGCDEVYSINICSRCQERKLKTHHLYYEHLTNVKRIVQTISPNTKVLFWSEFNYSQQRINLKYELRTYKRKLHDLEPVDWEYVGERVYANRLYKIHEIFDTLWFATAFKGADDIHGKSPNIMKRYLNHLNWLKQILIYQPPKIKSKINGVILTGWSRYSHFARQCELLPFSMPSLILNLLLINIFREGVNREYLNNETDCQFYNRFLKRDFESIFDIRGKNTECSFQNAVVYDLKFPNYKDCLARLQAFEIDIEINSFANGFDLSRAIQDCKHQLELGLTLSDKLRPIMLEFYRKEVIDNYLNETVNVFDTKVGDLIQDLTQKFVMCDGLTRRSYPALPMLKYGG